MADALERAAPTPDVPDDAFIRVRGLRKTYQMGETLVHALAGVDLDIPRSSFTVVMGPSGSGKSTLLHLIGGLDRPTAGQIELGGQRVDTLNENELAVFRRAVIGFVFQTFNLIPSMTALENVAFPMRFAGIPRRKRRERALELLERVGLANRAFHRPSELSGGQQQRVAIARALVNDPQVILADEPTGNLDTASSNEIIEMLLDLHRAGRTVLIVTHDLRMRGLSTNTVYLLDGKLVDEDSYMELSTLTMGRGTVTS
ncbi:MAG TPA: ABC transporter ATP-binding protein [Aggregatilineales bacterium]|nr:ABC transporter ATP-binding protein [Chloroflexota bacterium]HOA24305.1 ABC transporter ATP-binding protein [Aggregatilineales bacterium]HPV06777.1 ABC transporter ATP-binding protein [Aggregatilineales bacterium]HQA66865.1 ABC transporter ATP-binding protein [Aggregatilineales bacterium]HQE17483.1 ABC transporter ATP-binding protein [Aggregatilineales bacterium]